ncbi:hypothetical protein HDV06_003052 [Boothiomyces sp. JEL0866]|nr:hypothetical protein HDV06_003052 [Boothiomyces sp. JEL0866]
MQQQQEFQEKQQKESILSMYRAAPAQPAFGQPLVMQQGFAQPSFGMQQNYATPMQGFGPSFSSNYQTQSANYNAQAVPKPAQQQDLAGDIFKQSSAAGNNSNTAFKKQNSNNDLFKDLAAFGRSFFVTWFYMLEYFKDSYSSWKAESGMNVDFSLNVLSHWLEGTHLFDDAWKLVSVGYYQWFWSHQLCVFVVAVWTPFILFEGKRRNIPHIWAYMVIGQFVAISTASCLFYAAVASNPQTKNTFSKTNLLLLCVVLGLCGVIYIPKVADTDLFITALIAIHIVCLLPLVPFGASKITIQSRALTAGLYMFSAGAGLFILGQQILDVWWTLPAGNFTDLLSTFGSNLVETFFHHPAQSSIGSDIVLVNVITIFYILIEGADTLLILLTPVLTPSVTLGLYLAKKEVESISVPLKED